MYMETDATLMAEAERILGSQAKLAKAVGESSSFVYQMVTGRKPVPDRICVRVEKATGGVVNRKRFRPKTWHEMWPELAEK